MLVVIVARRPETAQRRNGHHDTTAAPDDPADLPRGGSVIVEMLQCFAAGDGIEDAAHRMVAYRVSPIPLGMVQLCEMIYTCSRALKKAFEALDKKKEVMEHCIEINRIENEADHLVRGLVTDLFENEKDCITLIKVKEIYEFLEATTDHCEDVADVLQNVVVKNG